MHSVRKPWWQQATALVTVSTGGVITGFSFVPGAAATMTSPTSVPLHLMALEKAAKPADAGAAGDARLRSAIVNVANYYLRLAQSRTPAQMEALIWAKDSVDGVDHGASCAAFASLTLELAAQAVGQQSWVSGGSSYPWPVHDWADVRVDPNPDSLGITSVMQDAQASNRWHPLGDGYTPQPGDWVLFDGHIEVVTGYAGGVLDTIGADSLPNLTVNAHSFADPLSAQGVTGFVDNGHLGGGTPASQGSQGTAGSPGSHGTPWLGQLPGTGLGADRVALASLVWRRYPASPPRPSRRRERRRFRAPVPRAPPRAPALLAAPLPMAPRPPRRRRPSRAWRPRPAWQPRRHRSRSRLVGATHPASGRPRRGRRTGSTPRPARRRHPGPRHSSRSSTRSRPERSPLSSVSACPRP